MAPEGIEEVWRPRSRDQGRETKVGASNIQYGGALYSDLEEIQLFPSAGFEP